jgi:uncharacterized RDD family membrane protein YckC
MCWQFPVNQRFVAGMLHAAAGAEAPCRRLAGVTAPSLTRRALALAIDWGAALLVTSLFTGGFNRGNPFVTLGIFFLMVTLPTAFVGLTLGKRLTSMAVVSNDGGPIGLPRAALRTALVCLVVPPLVTNDQGRGMHDVLTHSHLVGPRRGGGISTGNQR